MDYNIRFIPGIIRTKILKIPCYNICYLTIVILFSGPDSTVKASRELPAGI